ncbi:MAG TPA: hypothetical protein VFC32_12325 [Pseudolabrys sp.]|nr:hypothetical protein [Pseudolabrys sp.]
MRRAPGSKSAPPGLTATARPMAVKLDFIPRSPDAELVIRAIEPKPAAAGAA